jgi:ABC-2 type transport system permease protein
VIARRDFLAVVKTPTFLLFLLAPVFMLLFGWLGGSGASQVAEGASSLSRIAIIANERDADALRTADQRMRDYGDAPRLMIVAAGPDPMSGGQIAARNAGHGLSGSYVRPAGRARHPA